jgi:predicted nucleic acid-binding protein
MPISRVVLNASPLICLSKSGLTGIFPSLFEEIVVPDAVIKEITAEGKTDFAAKTLISQIWVRRIADIPLDPRVIAWDLGEGESAVLSFAVKNPGFWAVMDDREARRCALAIQCRFIGTLGILVLAKKKGIIPSLRDSLNQIQGAGFWLSASLVDEICQRSGEK